MHCWKKAERCENFVSQTFSVSNDARDHLSALLKTIFRLSTFHNTLRKKEYCGSGAKSCSKEEEECHDILVCILRNTNKQKMTKFGLCNFHLFLLVHVYSIDHSLV